jgi:hypothetical protein
MQPPTLETLAARLAAQEARLTILEQANQELVQARRRAERRTLLWRIGAFVCLVVGLLIGPPHPGEAQGGTVEARLGALETKLARVSVVNGGADIVISGANLNIVNGAGDTQSANGVGNLIIGYNEPRGSGLDLRTGSHNLVLGQQNNYFSFGGIIGGFQNTLGGPFSCVFTGSGNGALGFYSLVSTGLANNATGTYSAVLGGDFNVAGGFAAAVSGGQNNLASGPVSSVSGGLNNTASNFQASVSGGKDNTANNFHASVSGGLNNTASGEDSSISGGNANTAGALASSISGGLNEVIGSMMSNQFDWRAGDTAASDQ